MALPTTRLPAGPAHPLVTLHRMRAVVNDSLTDPVVIHAARSIVRPLLPRDYDGYARAVYQFMQEHFQFVPDPRGVEWLATPRDLLTGITQRGIVQGDCDEAAILGCALGKAVGRRCRFVVVAFSSPQAPYSHVYGLMQGASQWFSLDVTKPARSVAVVTRASQVEV